MVKQPDKPATAPVKQIDKFKDAARKAETDDREDAFEERLKKVAKSTSVKMGEKRS